MALGWNCVARHSCLGSTVNEGYLFSLWTFSLFVLSMNMAGLFAVGCILGCVGNIQQYSSHVAFGISKRGLVFTNPALPLFAPPRHCP